jgi:hypothetical protein
MQNLVPGLRILRKILGSKALSNSGGCLEVLGRRGFGKVKSRSGDASRAGRPHTVPTLGWCVVQLDEIRGSAV